MKSVSLAVSVALLVAPALAWMETIRNAGRLSLPVMKASKDDEMIEAYRARLEHTYSPHGEYGTAGFFGGASHLRDPVSSPLRDSYGEWSDENTLPCGEDCEVSHTLRSCVLGYASGSVHNSLTFHN